MTQPNPWISCPRCEEPIIPLPTLLKIHSLTCQPEPEMDPRSYAMVNARRTVDGAERDLFREIEPPKRGIMNMIEDALTASIGPCQLQSSPLCTNAAVMERLDPMAMAPEDPAPNRVIPTCQECFDQRSDMFLKASAR